MGILDTIGQQLGGDTLKQISQKLGTDEGTAAKAVSVALPLMIAGLSRNASTPDGSAALDQALTSDHSDSPVLNAPQQAVADPNAFNAGGILSHIFGQHQTPVQQGVAKASGIDLQSASKVLMILAPIVMASLARARNAQGANASAGQVLQQEQQHIERQVPGIGGLASILDRNHDGSIADDIANIAGGQAGGLGGMLEGGLGKVLGGLLGDRR
ncbi:MAG TPA: DUF937 domain-containing protein [Gemmatimonadaceae bacterium]|jgi:hypothetical protein|nr:DUF937 domain-containing protein [Gemmatimonadaceae bacterium]